jgi:hypothetical protein
VEKAIGIFLLCVGWETLAILYTRTAAHSLPDRRGYIRVFVFATAIALLGILPSAMTILDLTVANVAAWGLGSGVGAVVGLALWRK